MTGNAARPLRALAGIILFYAAGRVAMLTYDVAPVWERPPTVALREMLARAAPLLCSAPAQSPAPIEAASASILAGRGETVRPLGHFKAPALHAPAHPRPQPDRTTGFDIARLGAGRHTAADQALAAAGAASERVAQTSVPVSIPSADLARHSRRGISGSAWALVRQGSGGRDLASTGTLGGSQAGARLIVDVGLRPAFATARISGALAARDREIALGIGVRGRNLGAIIEQRFAVDGSGRRETAVLAYGGFSELAGPGGMRFDGYGQAGIVGISRRAPFADGALRAERTLVEPGRARLSAGAGIWGAAQPGASRLDVGPQIVIRTPLAGISTRIAAEYRTRIAGSSRPGDGLAISLGADF